MSQDPSIPRGIQPGTRIPGAAEGAQKAPAKSDGVAFRSLLERLEEQTRRLKEDGDHLADPAELAGAVDRAKSSIEDAVHLSRELLEAYRAARVRGETGEAEEA